MATYIVLANYTQQGVETIKDGPSRLKAAKDAFKAAGAQIKASYLTMGHYDLVIIVEAPDDAILATLLLKIGGQGVFRTETLRAFTEAEYRSIIAAL
jgi:uncharacterized protein with GYD domain